MTTYDFQQSAHFNRPQIDLKDVLTASSHQFIGIIKGHRRKLYQSRRGKGAEVTVSE